MDLKRIQRVQASVILRMYTVTILSRRCRNAMNPCVLVHEAIRAKVRNHCIVPGRRSAVDLPSWLSTAAMDNAVRVMCSGIWDLNGYSAPRSSLVHFTSQAILCRLGPTASTQFEGVWRKANFLVCHAFPLV